MKQKIIILAVALAICSCTDEKRTVTLVTYNVGAFCKYMENSMPVVADMMKEAGADFLSLNELDSCNVRSGLDNFQLKSFSEMMGGWNFHYSRAIEFGGGAYGIGVAVSPEYEVVNRFTVLLPKGDGSEVRALSVVETDLLVFASTHLDYTCEAAELEQARVITGWMTEHYGDGDKPVILAGDFNNVPDSPVLDYMRRDWTIVSPVDECTFPGEDCCCIDYIMLLNNGAEYEILDGGVLTDFKSGDVYKASDHLPVRVTLAL